MGKQLFHVYRNTPLGREVLMQSAGFCKRTGVQLAVYIPEFPQFLVYFEESIATVPLDRSFLRDPATAEAHVRETLEPYGIEYFFRQPARFTAKMLPEIAPTFDYMTCPRSIGSLSTRIGLGHIGPRVRTIVLNAPFPVLIPPPVCRDWEQVVCFYGGSDHAARALEVALAIGEAAACPVRVFTQATNHDRDWYRGRLEQAGLWAAMEQRGVDWMVFERGEFRENLFAVPAASIVIAGAYGRSLAKDLLFGSRMETIQTVLPNPLVIVGPRCRL